MTHQTYCLVALYMQIHLLSGFREQLFSLFWTPCGQLDIFMIKKWSQNRLPIYERNFTKYSVS